MSPQLRQPKVVVLGGGSWGTTVAAINARRGPTLQWVRSADTAEDINTNHRNTEYLGKDVALPESLRATTDFSEAANCADVIVMGVPSHGFRSVAHRAGQGTAALGAGGVPGQGPRAGHQHADERDRRGSAARSPRGHPGRAEHRQGGRRGVRRRGGAGDARPEPGRRSGKAVSHHAVSDLHHRRRGGRRDGRGAEERLRDRGRHGLFARHRREHPRHGDDACGARDVQARRGGGRPPRHLRRAGRHGRSGGHLHRRSAAATGTSASN